MRLKINRACDLNSISVLPPHSRRANTISTGMESSSIFSKSQPSQLRNSISGIQPALSQSQQSFSQGMPLSQLSQNSIDEILTNEQRFGSQERDNSMKRISYLAPVSYAREDTSQLQLARSSNNGLRRWNSGSVSDHRCQISEELENRIGTIDTTLNRLGMILDSVQSDLIQVNKTVKEVSLETEGIRQKMVVHDSSLQLMLKGEEDIKASLDWNLKSLPDQLRKESNQHKLQEIVSVLSTMPDQIEARFLKLKDDLFSAFTKEMEAMTSRVMPLNDNHSLTSVQPIIAVAGKAKPLKVNCAAPPRKRTCRANRSQKPQQSKMEEFC